MEIRLCSVDAALWLEGLDDSLTCSSVEPPERFGLTIGKALQRRFRECKRVSDVKLTGPVGAVLAKAGVSFASGDFLASVAHALACASAYEPVHEVDAADEIESFVLGRGGYGFEVPESLRQAGVYSVLRKEMSERLAEWIEAIDNQDFLAEVAEMHGEENVEDFSAAATSLADILGSVRVHGSDLCCYA